LVVLLLALSGQFIRGLNFLKTPDFSAAVRNLATSVIMDQYLKQNRDGMAKAVTPRSKAVLEDNIKFIQQIKSLS